MHQRPKRDNQETRTQTGAFMSRHMLCYLFFGFILIVYGAHVCPFLEGLGYVQASINTLVPILIVFPFRIYWLKTNIHRLRWFGSAQSIALYSLPWREFAGDLVLWGVIGLGISVFYILHLGAPLLTGAKILLGCISFGLLGGMLCYLWMESRIIAFLQNTTFEIPISPKKIFSVSNKILFFMIVVLGFMATAILLMVFMDVSYLLEQGGSSDTEIYIGVFKEIAFAFGVLLFLSLLILGKYSQNLKAALSLQLEVMQKISLGDFEASAPVVSNDEFGLIAAKTNEMMTGLKERDLCRLSFGLYLTPEVSQKILKGEIPLEGELKDVTILFCDLRGYTTFVEGRDPKEVVSFLNEYFTQMEQAIKAQQGIVLQYIGDEIEAVFGAPLDLPRHPERAVLAALQMRERLEELNRKREAAGQGRVAHGIGIHTGRVFAGSVGSQSRLSYAMVGDPVNTASRIQSLNKTFGTDILISRSTKDLLPADRFVLASQGMSSLRGKSESIEVYTVLR
jgi:adenylate cyclase